MTSRNAVLWKEGCSSNRSTSNRWPSPPNRHCNSACPVLNDAFYGCSELELNAEYLSFGKVAILRARGVMPDGTVFDIPGDMPLPAPLEIPRGVPES